MTESLIKSCHKKSKLLKKYKKYPSIVNKLAYKKYKNILKTVVRAAERDYYLTKFTETVSDIKGTWKIINSILKTTAPSNLIACLKINNIMKTDAKMIVEEFNSYFINIGPNLAKNILDPITSFNQFLT